VGDDTIVATGASLISNDAYKEWLAIPESLVLTPQDDDNPVYTWHEVTATLKDTDGNGIEDEPITFTVISGPNAGADGTGYDINGNPVNNTNVSYTDANGEAKWEYLGTVASPPDDVIQATGAGLTSNTVTKYWIPPALELLPLDDTNPVGHEHELTATLRNSAGDPIEDKPVTFTVISGPNAGATGTGYDIDGNPVSNTNVSYTDANGEAKWSYVGLNVGTDTIEATGEGETSNQVTKTWEPPVLTLTPLSATNPPQTEHTVTAMLTESDGTPIPGVLVEFEITDGPNVGLTGSDTTNASGEATFVYTDQGLATGTDTIVATCTVEDIGGVDITDIPLQASAGKTWKKHDIIPGMTTWGTIAAVLGLCVMALAMIRRRGILYYSTR
jgi:hypothetical protein